MEIVAETWIKNNTYQLKFSDRDILVSVTGWFNDSLMDIAQKFVCKSLGRLESWQLVSNWQKKCCTFSQNAGENHIQSLHKGVNHWLLSFNSISQVQVCNSLHTKISSVTKECLKALYKSLIEKDGKLTITIVPVQTQKDGYNCGLFAIAFAADIVQGISPTESCFQISRMREHLKSA